MPQINVAFEKGEIEKAESLRERAGVGSVSAIFRLGFIFGLPKLEEYVEALAAVQEDDVSAEFLLERLAAADEREVVIASVKHGDIDESEELLEAFRVIKRIVGKKKPNGKKKGNGTPSTV